MKKVMLLASLFAIALLAFSFAFSSPAIKSVQATEGYQCASSWHFEIWWWFGFPIPMCVSDFGGDAYCCAGSHSECRTIPSYRCGDQD